MHVDYVVDHIYISYTIGIDDQDSQHHITLNRVISITLKLSLKTTQTWLANCRLLAPWVGHQFLIGFLVRPFLVGALSSEDDSELIRQVPVAPLSSEEESELVVQFLVE